MMFVLGGEKTVAGVWDEETLLVSPTVRRWWFETDDSTERSWLSSQIRYGWPRVLSNPGKRSHCCHGHTNQLLVQLYHPLETGLLCNVFVYVCFGITGKLKLPFDLVAIY
jgi:hypothetical protein